MKEFSERIFDAVEAGLTVALGVFLVLALVWAGEALGGDFQINWTQDETVSVDAFHVERRDSVEPATWVPLTGEPVPDGSGGPYQMEDLGLANGVYLYRVQAENTVGTSAWAYSTWVTAGDPEPTGQPPTNPVWQFLIQIFQPE